MFRIFALFIALGTVDLSTPKISYEPCGFAYHETSDKGAGIITFLAVSEGTCTLNITNSPGILVDFSATNFLSFPRNAESQCVNEIQILLQFPRNNELIEVFRNCPQPLAGINVHDPASLFELRVTTRNDSASGFLASSFQASVQLSEPLMCDFGRFACNITAEAKSWTEVSALSCPSCGSVFEEEPFYKSVEEVSTFHVNIPLSGNIFVIFTYLIDPHIFESDGTNDNRVALTIHCCGQTRYHTVVAGMSASATSFHLKFPCDRPGSGITVTARRPPNILLFIDDILIWGMSNETAEAGSPDDQDGSPNDKNEPPNDKDGLPDGEDGSPNGGDGSPNGEDGSPKDDGNIPIDPTDQSTLIIVVCIALGITVVISVSACVVGFVFYRRGRNHRKTAENIRMQSGENSSPNLSQLTLSADGHPGDQSAVTHTYSRTDTYQQLDSDVATTDLPSPTYYQLQLDAPRSEYEYADPGELETAGIHTPISASPALPQRGLHPGRREAGARVPVDSARNDQDRTYENDERVTRPITALQLERVAQPKNGQEDQHDYEVPRR